MDLRNTVKIDIIAVVAELDLLTLSIVRLRDEIMNAEVDVSTITRPPVLTPPTPPALDALIHPHE